VALRHLKGNKPSRIERIDQPCIERTERIERREPGASSSDVMRCMRCMRGRLNVIRTFLYVKFMTEKRAASGSDCAAPPFFRETLRFAFIT
jgi:hypothetical protein